LKELKGKVDLVLRDGRSPCGLESTVLDVTRVPFRILRPGFVTLGDLKRVVPTVVQASPGTIRGKSRSPGMKCRHYKPSCRIVLVPPEKWEKSIRGLRNKNVRLGVLSCTKKIPAQKNIVFKRSFRNSKYQFARNLYSTFFKAEEKKVQVLVVESMGTRGLGAAIMDRLRRAGA
jgi:L-threonylcarbamoyladenylate synthase